MKTTQTRNRLAFLAFLMTAFGALPVMGAVSMVGHNTLTQLTPSQAFASVAPADTAFMTGEGQIYSSFVLTTDIPSRITELRFHIDYNLDGDFTDFGEVNVDFTSGGVTTPGSGSPGFAAYTGPGLSGPLPSGTPIVGGGPLQTFVVYNHEIGMGGQSFHAQWEGVFTAETGGATTPFSMDVTNVPEPSGMALMSLMGATMLLFRRR